MTDKLNLQPIVISEEDLARIEIPVTLGNTDFVLKEATGTVITDRDNAVLSGTIMENGKPKRVSGLGVIDAKMLGECLCKKNGSVVGVAFVQKQPHRVREQLIERLKHISRIEDEEETVSKEEIREVIEAIKADRYESNEGIVKDLESLISGVKSATEEQLGNSSEGTMDGSD